MSTAMSSETSGPRLPSGFRADLERLLRWRRDVRRFRAEPLPAGALERLLALAATAPSVGLSQPWRFVLVEDPERRAKIRANFEASNAAALQAQGVDRAGLYARLKLAGLDEAPCHLAVFAEPEPRQGAGLGRRTMPETTAYSTVLAIHTLWLAAQAEGLGLGWLSILDPAGVAAILEVPASWTFVGYLCLGYPAAPSETPELEREGWERRRTAEATILRR